MSSRGGLSHANRPRCRFSTQRQYDIVQCVAAARGTVTVTVLLHSRLSNVTVQSKSPGRVKTDTVLSSVSPVERSTQYFVSNLPPPPPPLPHASRIQTHSAPRLSSVTFKMLSGAERARY